MTEIIVRVAVMWQINILLHGKERKWTEFVMRQEGKRSCHLTLLSDRYRGEQGLLAKGSGNITPYHPSHSLHLVRREPDQETNMCENCSGEREKKSLDEAGESPTTSRKRRKMLQLQLPYKVHSYGCVLKEIHCRAEKLIGMFQRDWAQSCQEN